VRIGRILVLMLRRALILSAVAALALVATRAPAATYQVGPARTYKTLGAVASLVSPGDVVEVDGDATYAAVNFTRAGSASARITIRGIRVGGKRPIVSGGTNTIELAGDHYVLEGFDITGGSSRCVFHHAHDITIRDSVVHDCPKQGILGADQDSGSLLLEYTEVHHAGGGTFDHQIYMATDEVAHPGAIFRMQYCYVHDGNGGNSVKSRAERNEIYYNWIEGALYHELELIGPDPGGAASGWSEGLKREDSDVVGNVLKKTRDFSFVRLGGDGTGQSRGRYRFKNNTFIGGFSGNTAFRLFDTLESVEMHNNVFFSSAGAYRIVRDVEAVWTAGPRIAGSNNWVFTGSTFVPTQWTATITATNPGFTNASANDYSPSATSALLNAGASTTSGPTGYAFPSPLAAPLFHPPVRALIAPGTAVARPTASVIDIGAFERGTVTPTDAGATDTSAPDTATPPTDTATREDSSAVVDTEGSDTTTIEGDTSMAVDSESADVAIAADSASEDAAAIDAAPSDLDGSCGCRTPRGGGTSFGFVGLGLALLALTRRRG